MSSAAIADSIRSLANHFDDLGSRLKSSLDAYNKAVGQYAHASGIMVVTPEGRLSHYFYGIEYGPRDLRLALVEAGDHKIGSPVDQLLLACFHYDPASGKYSLAVMRVVRAGGVATLLVIGGAVVMLRRRERRGPLPTDPAR